MTLIAHISDFHIRIDHQAVAGGFNVRAQALINELNACIHPIDLVVMTGDLTENGSDEEYALADALLSQLRFPLIIIPGNHDRVPAFLRRFAGRFGVSPDPITANGLTLFQGLRLLALDTTIPDEIHGQVDADTLAWLAEALSAEPNTPTLIFMHHPPMPTGIPAMDRLGLRYGADTLGALLRQHGQVVAIFCGHVHRPVTTVWNGVYVAAAKSSSVSFSLDYADVAVKTVDEPYSIFLHRVERGTVVSQAHYMTLV